MRTSRLTLLTLSLIAIAGPALAQAANNPYNVSWAALNPAGDWSAQILTSLFPVPGTTALGGFGTENNIIQLIAGQLTGYIGAIACAFVTYNVLMNIHRAAESARMLGEGQTSMFVVRMGLAGIMMFPLGGGFSAGQGLVMQSALLGVGMAKVLYTNAVQAIGGGITVPPPQIPGTQQIVSGLVEDEFCMDLVNLASGTGTAQNPNPLVPIPPGITVGATGNGIFAGTITYRYGLSTDNGIGSSPVCGTVNVVATPTTTTTFNGTNLNMAAVQQAILQNVLTKDIRNQVAQIASSYWGDKKAADLSGLQGIFVQAVSDYTTNLSAAATAVANALNANLQANQAGLASLQNGQNNLLQGEVQQSTLGWSGAGAYYLEIAQLNANTLGLLNNIPTVSPPSYQGLSDSLTTDLQPLMGAVNAFMTTLNYAVSTADGTTTPTGIAHDLGEAQTPGLAANLLTWVAGKLQITQTLLATLTNWLIPTTTAWTDPFVALIQGGQTLMNASLAGMGLAAALASPTVSTGSAIVSLLHLDLAGAAASIGGHAVMSFLATPIYLGLLSLLVPGIMISYVLPMIPWVMWMAGVCGWIILVCEAMIAVPLWALAHMTIGGDGLHGRATEGWALLFSVVFRPSLMVIGLFLSYYVFGCMSWLIRETFGIAAAQTLQQGWIVTNFIGVAVLLNIFVMTQVTAAFMSFRLVALLPHHLPRLIGFSAASRVDVDEFRQQAAWMPGRSGAGETSRALQSGLDGFQKGAKSLSSGSSRAISGRGSSSREEGTSAGGMDESLRAQTDTSGGVENG